MLINEDISLNSVSHETETCSTIQTHVFL
jgi:hypothetical protein